MELYIHDPTRPHVDHREPPHSVIISHLYTNGTKWQSQGELVENICSQERKALTLSLGSIYLEEQHLNIRERVSTLHSISIYAKECPSYTVSQYM